MSTIPNREIERSEKDVDVKVWEDIQEEPRESLQALEAALADFLEEHMRKLRTLRNNANDGDFVKLDKHGHTISENPLITEHLNKLSQFLANQERNAQTLRRSLLEWGYVSGGSQEQIGEGEHTKQPKQRSFGKAYDSLTQQFNVLVMISTFTAALIVSFVALVYQIVGPARRIAFDVGMVLSFFAMGVHFGTILVAGRGAALTSTYSDDDEILVIHSPKMPEELAKETVYERVLKGVRHDNPIEGLKYFHHYLHICEQLQFFATNLFLIAIAELIFLVFSDVGFPLALLGGSFLAATVVFWSVYWEVSLTFKNIMVLVTQYHRWVARIKKKREVRHQMA